MENAIEVNNISKIYRLYHKPTDRLKEAISPYKLKLHKDFFALHDISFTIGKGEAIGIIGKNGSGKSTLLKIITGVLSPSSGNVAVDGRISALLELGTGFNPEMSGLENLYLNGSMMGYSRAEMEQRIPLILEFADIGEYIDQPVKTYSSGMFARLAFALAIHVDPNILIVDEALAVGDMAFQLKCYKKFNDFKANGKTILFVSHSLDSILRYCDRAIVLHEGRMVAIGNTKEMVDIYKQLLVNNYDPDVKDPKDNHSAGHEANTGRLWKEQFQPNPDTLAYGDGTADIIDIGLFDQNDRISTNIISGECVTLRMRIRFQVTMEEPIFAFTIKDLKGNEIAGTNTMFSLISTGSYLPGDEVTVAFNQKFSFASGGYTISFGCVHYKGEELVVCQRLYDAILLEVFSSQRIVGLFDVNSDIDIQKQDKA